MSNISQILISLLGDYELEMDVLLQLLDLRPTELVILALLFVFNDNLRKLSLQIINTFSNAMLNNHKYSTHTPPENKTNAFISKQN